MHKDQSSKHGWKLIFPIGPQMTVIDVKKGLGDEVGNVKMLFQKMQKL